MTKRPYEKIVCNYQYLSEDRKQELIKVWNYGVASLIISEISKLPLHLQKPVLEELKADLYPIKNFKKIRLRWISIIGQRVYG